MHKSAKRLGGGLTLFAEGGDEGRCIPSRAEVEKALEGIAYGKEGENDFRRGKDERKKRRLIVSRTCRDKECRNLASPIQPSFTKADFASWKYGAMSAAAVNCFARMNHAIKSGKISMMLILGLKSRKSAKRIAPGEIVFFVFVIFVF